MKATVTTKALQQAFGVSHMSIAAWRQGTATRAPLPIVDNKVRAVLFEVAKVRAWAKKHAVPIVDESALEPGAVSAVKPGPKQKPVVKKSALRTKKASPRKTVKPLGVTRKQVANAGLGPV